jgi:hypothetical protein
LGARAGHDRTRDPEAAQRVFAPQGEAGQ